MKFKLEIELGNDAMQTSGDVAHALKNISRTLLEDTGYIQAFQDHHIVSIKDANGNKVGTWTVKAK